MLFLLIALLACLSAGCDLLGETSSWQAVLPALPAAWLDTFPDAKADLLVVDPDGSFSSMEVSLAAGVYPVELRKERNSLVLLYPKAGGERLRPFGAIFPASADLPTRTLALTSTGGFTAERLRRLAERGVDVRGFNTERALALMEERGGDPWDLDAALFEARLAAGEFSVYAIKRLPVRSVSLALPSGAWFAESPGSPLWESDGQVTIPEIAYGNHVLFRRGGNERVYLTVSEKDIIVFGL